MISQNGSGNGPVQQQSIMWANVDPDMSILWRH